MIIVTYSMILIINPDILCRRGQVGVEQGYESLVLHSIYRDGLNVDPGNTGKPLVVSPGSSVIKSISLPQNTGKTILSDAVVLTVLDSAPPAGSFRPPYVGADKSIVGTESDLNYSVLGSHPRLGSEPDINIVTAYYERLWLEHNTAWTQRDIHPTNSMPNYGRDIANMSGKGLILLQLDYSDAEKRELLIRLVQYGIDIYGIVGSGAEYESDGGENCLELASSFCLC